ncbi:hypothetical protein FI667_g9506, partial [Globisporangium splendens]
MVAGKHSASNNGYEIRSGMSVQDLKQLTAQRQRMEYWDLQARNSPRHHTSEWTPYGSPSASSSSSFASSSSDSPPYRKNNNSSNSSVYAYGNNNYGSHYYRRSAPLSPSDKMFVTCGGQVVSFMEGVVNAPQFDFGPEVLNTLSEPPRAISFLAAALLICFTFVRAASSFEAKLTIVNLDAPAHTLVRSSAEAVGVDEAHGGTKVVFVPLVSARSRTLNNNIAITQSHLVLSSLDQSDLLQKLLDVVDLAPKLSAINKMAMTQSQGTAKQEASSCDLQHSQTSGGASRGHGECVCHRRGYLVDLTALKKKDVVDADLALIDLGDVSTLGFGWRYPIAYWNQLRDDEKRKLKCAVNQVIGQSFYC